jgi:DNA-directed RNA polymerase subunit RPC12/RpoP
MPVKSTCRKRTTEGKLPLIRCSRCGAEIMLVPNVKLMSDAIEAHVEMHKSKMKNLPDAEAEAEQIRDDLIRQVLDRASEQGALIANGEQDTSEP